MIPKYVTTQREIINLIASGGLAVGSVLPTEKELSQRLGVSIITIRRAMKELEEQRIVRREQGRGTFVTADIERRTRKGTIALLGILREEVPFPTTGTSVTRLSTLLGRRAYRLTQIAAGPTPDREAVKLLRRVDGVLATGWVTPQWVQMLAGMSVPVVFIGAVGCDTQRIPVVAHDWRKMASVLVDELYARGARRFGMLTGGKNYAPSSRMHDGMVAAAKRHKARCGPDAVFYSDRDVPRAMREFLEEHSDIDGLLVEAGCYVHLLGWLLGKRSRPRVGVLSVQLSLGQMPDGFVEAGFKGDLYELSVERLFASHSAGGARRREILLEPVLGT